MSTMLPYPYVFFKCVAASYSNMGGVFHSQGDYPKALEYYEKCLEIRLSTLGAEHPSSLQTSRAVERLRTLTTAP